MVKAQIHAGGSGKGGGIKLVKTLEELRGHAERMLGKPLVTPQTGPKGRPVAQVYVVEDIADRARALSLAARRSRLRTRRLHRLDRRRREHRGGRGQDAGEDHHRSPSIRPPVCAPFHTRIIASALEARRATRPSNARKLVGALYRLFLEKDASLIEINPLVVTKDGKLICLDAKIGFDDNALSPLPRTSPSCRHLNDKSRPKCKGRTPASAT